MGKDDDKNTHSSAWLWPAEWAVERAFWREVGTRTIAGVLTIVVIGVPTLLWAAISGALQWETVAPIIVGIAFFGIVATIYTSVVVGIRRREARKIAETLAVEEFISNVIPDPSTLSSYSAEQQSRIMEMVSEAGRSKVRQTMRIARITSRLAAIGGLSGLIGAAIAAAALTPLVTNFIMSITGSGN